MSELSNLTKEIYKAGKRNGNTTEEIFNAIRDLPEFSYLYLQLLLKDLGGSTNERRT